MGALTGVFSMVLNFSSGNSVKEIHYYCILQMSGKPGEVRWLPWNILVMGKAKTGESEFTPIQSSQ